jgi:mannose/fructose/N-acetylgalactosamine-specific phosphotransferase system component IIC
MTGLILGRPAEAAVLGIILELFSLVILPIGAARYPEAGIGAVAATFAYTASAGAAPAPAALMLAVVFGLAWEQVAGISVIMLRRANGSLMAAAPARGAVGARRLERLHLSAITLDGIRAVLVVLAGAWLGHWVLGAFGPHWWLDGDTTLRILVVAVAVILGAALPLFGGGSTRRLAFALGIICGTMLLLSR